MYSLAAKGDSLDAATALETVGSCSVFDYSFRLSIVRIKQ